MEQSIICPYPGLRPFNEDEAIFFKGREEHIEQIVTQLEEKKFLMLTGASGDGKSSLVYAGVIPNARAGFFKAKFNNWVVADFRPERDPLKNMATAINEQLKIKDADKVEKELSYGFSSLIDAYKSSPFWIDQQSDTYLHQTTDEQKKLKRKGANLLILVDQFEEFFTNPENYKLGRASLESQTVVNLLLETTRLAIEQDLPIYIICTMRSDYIGQCASFRGLPEYIGYSQFFVPRLKRKEIYQVIEEPALLNGNKISKRLVEMLINEMSDGIDQLPVLQHALNQIWQQADKGTVEMDLIHFAKINGIPKEQLAKEDRIEFDKWFSELPAFKQNFMSRSSLGDVLDAHANELYETANNELEDTLTLKDAKLIVKTTYKCLTKIDESRAVRNRMTLEEVTQIINQPHITTKVVAKALLPFRIQGNTFLKPFILDQSATKDLPDHSVLDITHESLIRNWDKLSFWANQEHEHLLTWQDFYKQLQRWVNSEKSSGYLLPIGPLTFFETWFNKVKINKYWLARYDEREMETEQKLADAELILANTRQFIKRSARRLFLSRTVLKYGADKLIAVFFIALFVFSCAYFYFDFRKKQNDYVIVALQEKSKELLKSKYIKSKAKAEYILIAERLNPGIYKDLLKNVEGDSAQIEVVREMFSNCLGIQEGKKDGEQDNPLVGKLFLEQLNLIETKEVFKSNATLIRNINNILGTVYGHIVLKRNKFPINDNGGYEKFCLNAYIAFNKLIADTATLSKVDIEQFNKLLQVVPSLVDYDSLMLEKVASSLSPFRAESKPVFNVLYPKEKTVQQNWNENLTYNGGYFQLCNLFALTNNFGDMNKCFDSLLVHNKSFLNTSYGYSFVRILNDLIITGKLFSKEGIALKKKIIDKRTIKNNFPMEVIMLNNLLVDKKDVTMFTIQRFTIPNSHPGYDLQLQWEKIDYSTLNTLAEDIINDFIKNPLLNSDEKNYMAALLYKAKAFVNDKNENLNYELINQGFKKSLSFYEKVSADYLKGDINIGDGADIKTIQRSKVYKFGGLLSLTNGWEPFSYYYTLENYKDKTVFFDYVVKAKGLTAFYLDTDVDVQTLNKFLLNYYSVVDFNDKTQKLLDPSIFADAIDKKRLPKNFQIQPLLAYMTLYYDHKNESHKAVTYAEQINHKELLNKEQIKKDNDESHYYKLAQSLLNYYFKQPYKPLVSEMDDENQSAYTKETKAFDNGFKLLSSFSSPYQKRNALLINIDTLQRAKREIITIALMDTLLNSEILKSSKFGNKFFEILGRLSTNKGDQIAMLLLKDRADKIKPSCLRYFVDGKSQRGYYYQATTFIPDYVSSSSQLSLYTVILKNEIKSLKVKLNDGWSKMDGPEDRDEWVNGGYEYNEVGNFWVQSE